MATAHLFVFKVLFFVFIVDYLASDEGLAETSVVHLRNIEVDVVINVDISAHSGGLHDPFIAVYLIIEFILEAFLQPMPFQLESPQSSDLNNVGIVHLLRLFMLP